MFRICSDNAQNLFRLLGQYSECSESVLKLFRMFRFFRQCSECSESVLTLFILIRLCSDNVQSVKNLFRIFSKCSECSEYSESVQNVQNLLGIFRLCSDFFRISSTKTGLFRISWLCSYRDVTTWAKCRSALPECHYPSTILLQATNSLINSHMWQRWAPWGENKTLHRRYIHVFNIWLKHDKLWKKYYKLINLKKKRNQIHIL